MVLRRLLGRIPPKQDSRAVGITGEEEAARLLKRGGFRVIEKNFRTRAGEIDIIALDGDTVVFVEVKTRSGDSFGLPKDAVGALKQRRILSAARAYLAANPRLKDSPVRFDVIGIFMAGASPVAEHIKDAFDAGE
ncbi:MAG: YraN family protein [Deltaproteobacteria bacterium]|nr:YraN family protein [Deltaproteobacteria bacterium]